MKMKPIKMDLQQRQIIHTVDAVRKEAWSRELEIILTSGGEPYFIPSDTAVFICYKKEDRTEGCYDTLPDGSPAWKLSGNTLTIVLSDQVLTYPGRVMLTVVFAHAGTELCTFPIEVTVHPSAWNKSVNSEDYFNLTRFLIAPSNAKVGQILQVASVDKTGKVTALRAVDSETSAGDPADIPVYWQTALDEGVQAINTALCEAGRNKSAFLFYTDAHWNYGAQMAPTLLKYLYQHTGLTKTFFGGDIVNDEASDYDTMKYLWDWRKQLKDLPNHHSVVGNHDDVNSTDKLFSEQYVYGYLLGAEETPDMVLSDTGLYYYIDNPTEKTRYLCLDTGYQDAYALSDDQADFIKTSLRSTPESWHIVVVAHIWYTPDYDRYNERPVPLTGLSGTAASITGILDDYNSRSGEFSDCGAWVEFCIGGHIHYDYDAVTSTGIPIILVETDSHHTRGNYTAAAGTITESAVNGIIADYDNHKIHVLRIGRGESREITMTNVTASYTNVLPLALAADGTSIYNAEDTPGYKANTRWSQSSQADQDREGTYITGWIPVSFGDVIRLRNMDTKSDSLTILYSNAPGSTSGSSSFDNIMNTWCGVADESGNLIQFEMRDETPYIRIMCGYIGSDSIITINEPIE